MKHVHFSVVYPDRFVHPLHRQLTGDAAVSRAELLTWSPTADATTLFWCDGDRAATERVVTGLDSLRSASFVSGTDGTYAFLAQDDYEFPARLLGIIEGATVVFRPPVVFLESGAVRFQAVGDPDALGAFHDALAEIADLTIERVQEFRRGETPARLTDRQAEALEAAVSVGYYEVPRRGTVEDVADALDCSTSTAGELVRKAEAAVIRSHAGKSAQ